jgi:hypothetical protein
MKREPRWRAAGTPELWRAISQVWDLGRRTTPRRFPPGVYRHRSIEHLDALTEEWARSRFRKLQDDRAHDVT